ncbi:MHYT domain-containing protein [Nocardia brasiliensis]
MSYFTMGYWIIGLSVAVSMVGALIGFTCIRQSAKSSTGRFRTVWQVAAAVSIGGIGVWLPVFVSLLGFSVRGSLVRYDVTNVTGAVFVAVLTVWAALTINGITLRIPRLIAAGVVMGSGFGLMHYLALDAIRIQGSTTLQLPLILGAAAIAIVTALAALWFTQTWRPLPALVAAALVFAAGIAGMHYTDLVGLETQVSVGVSPPPGEDLFGFFVPVFVLSMMSLAIPISAILIAPERRAPVALRTMQPTSGL